MLAVALALAASVAYGISDFLGGLTSRSVALLPVLLVLQGTALILLFMIVVSRGEGPGDRVLRRSSLPLLVSLFPKPALLP